jgi:hypothetical protein
MNELNTHQHALFEICASTVGQSVEGSAFRKLKEVVGVEPKVQPKHHTAMYSFRDTGIELYTEHGIVQQVILLLQPIGTEMPEIPYQGNLPFGISQVDDRTLLHEKLGMQPRVWDFGPEFDDSFELFDLPAYQLLVQFDNNQSSIFSISLRLRRSKPCAQ